jgi:NAD(P)H-flavin reductase
MTIEEKKEKNRLKNILWRRKNREKCCKATAAWRIKHPHYERDRKWNERYGITPERYDEMVRSQNNQCAICGNVETAKHNRSNKIQKLAVDHCHSTGKVRGLLCQDCNRGLGKFHDDVVRLESAIIYLRQARL